MSISIPTSHRDLLDRNAFAHLATINPDGTPQLTPVWFDHHDHDGNDCLLVNSTAGRVKNRNARANPAVAIEIQDPTNPYRYLTIRGTVIEITNDPGDHLETLAHRYLHTPYPWWGPDEQREILHIQPARIAAIDIEAHNPNHTEAGDGRSVR